VAGDEKPTSIWKKEISFRRRADGDAAAAAVDEAPTSIWKKEISLRKKDKAEAPAPTEPAAAPAPTLEEELLPVPLELSPLPDPVLEPGQLPAPEPAPTLPPAAAVEHDWLTQPLEEVSEPPAPEPLPVIPVAPAPVAMPEALVAEPELPALPEPAVLPEPPVEAPTAVLPPAAEPEPQPERVPFYKRELSFGRRARRSKDAAETETEPETEPEMEAEAPARARRAPSLPAVSLPKLSLPSVSLPSLSRGNGTNGRYVGLKIGGSQIAAARIHNGEVPELVQAARVGLEHGIVVNGELRDPEALAVVLKDFFARHKLPKRGVRLGIANNRIGVRTFEVSGIEDPKQLANAIRFRAQEVLPIPLEEAVMDYQVLSEGTSEDGQPVRRVLLVVAYRELVDRYVEACRQAGLQIVGIDLEAFALLRAVAPPQDPGAGERGALVAVSVGHDRSTFAVSNGRVCEFTRVLEWGGWALNVAIARALDLAPSEVENVKRALSFAGPSVPPDGFDEGQLQTALEAARRQLQTFARELVSSLQFYQNQPGSLGIGEIALTGGTAHLPGLAAERERLIGVPVRVVDPLGRLQVSKKAAGYEQVGSLAVAIGLGIED
jgi:type IV pilus assembly protein PilM